VTISFRSKQLADSAACSTSCEGNRGAPTIVMSIQETKRPNYFTVKIGSNTIVKSSKQPRSEAARALRDLGFPDDTFLVSRRAGSDVVSMQGRLGDWRKLRIKQGRNGPEFATYDAFPCARVEERRPKLLPPSGRVRTANQTRPACHQAQPTLQEVPPRAFPLATLPPWHQMNRSKRNPALRKPALETNA
jgi:hypothetical protein